MNKSLSTKLFAMSAKMIWFIFTILTLWMYSACSSKTSPESPQPPVPEPPTPPVQQPPQQTYTISFNTNGGGEVASQNINADDRVARPSDPTRIGYRFDEWYRNPSLSDDPYDFENTAITANITLYANWVKTFAVVFDLNIGEGATRTGEDEAEEIDDVLPEVVDSSARAAKPSEVPTRQGYRFLNWYSNRNAPSTAYDFENTAVTGNVILYANWQRTFTVTFNTNKGDDLRTETIDSGLVAVEQPTDTINTEHGGTFVGWYSDEELTREYNFSAPVTQDLSLYVKWSYMVTYNETRRTITGLNPNLPAGDVHLVIPSNINGLMMETIVNNAFENKTRIVSLRIAGGITGIGDNVFRASNDNNTQLSISRIKGGLVIPSTVETIGNGAFLNCIGLTGPLVIPNSVRTIGQEAFRECAGFNGSLTIGNSVETIGRHAFNGCTGFTGPLVIPNSVKTIGNYAFSECAKFSGRLVIPNSVKTIGVAAFSSTGFTGNLIIGNSVKTIGINAFGETGFTGPLVIPDSVETIGQWAFLRCTGFTGSLVIPKSVDTIGAWAFQGTKGISSFVFKSRTPPGIGPSIFLEAGKDEWKIRVPSGASALYKAVPNLVPYNLTSRLMEAQ